MEKPQELQPDMLCKTVRSFFLWNGRYFTTNQCLESWSFCTSYKFYLHCLNLLLLLPLVVLLLLLILLLVLIDLPLSVLTLSLVIYCVEVEVDAGTESLKNSIWGWKKTKALWQNPLIKSMWLPTPPPPIFLKKKNWWTNETMKPWKITCPPCHCHYPPSPLQWISYCLCTSMDEKLVKSSIRFSSLLVLLGPGWVLYMQENRVSDGGGEQRGLTFWSLSQNYHP